MIIKVLIENTTGNDMLSCAHGLSLYVETAHHKVLVDAGPDGRFARNAEHMGIDLSLIDTVILSHGHYDHSGGLAEFMRINKTAKIYAGEGYGNPHYDKNLRYIGVEPAIVNNPRITELKAGLIIDEELGIINCNYQKLHEPIDDCGMTCGSLCDDGSVRLEKEIFDHEIYLLVKDNNRRVLFTGCTHKGIVNVAMWAASFCPDAVVGGFHFMDIPREDFRKLDMVSGKLLELPAIYYTCHCTGLEQYSYMKEKMGRRLGYLATGDSLTI
ncbi:MAG: MBL fold metallo-hydrolase [Lachnospiraceae bacterium]|jgi:7,8-dihydropterin-6-yl-methyl-4-(beta-D-ribofuranosyl)aminobenzene 5'-phosphate synthase